jgi:signal transduction histidine kinase
VIFLTWQWVRAVLASRRHRQQLELAHKQLQEYASQLNASAIVEAQNRFACDFYDALGQSLAALYIQIQTAYKLHHIEPGQAQISLVEAQHLSSSTLQEIRRAIKVLGRNSRINLPEQQEVYHDSPTTGR